MSFARVENERSGSLPKEQRMSEPCSAKQTSGCEEKGAAGLRPPSASEKSSCTAFETCAGAAEQGTEYVIGLECIPRSIPALSARPICSRVGSELCAGMA